MFDLQAFDRTLAATVVGRVYVSNFSKPARSRVRPS